jgi:hypothetical protein
VGRGFTTLHKKWAMQVRVNICGRVQESLALMSVVVDGMKALIVALSIVSDIKSWDKT